MEVFSSIQLAQLRHQVWLLERTIEAIHRREEEEELKMREDQGMPDPNVIN